jgi:Brp/Blh family beta-carotene 15,15'-monooxygenase
MAYRYILSALLVILALFVPEWITVIEIPLFVALVGTVGILHGALDHQVAFRHYGLRTDTRGWVVFLGGYLGVMVLYGLVWYVLPLLALVVFLALSVWHFGQSDMHGFKMRRGENIMNITRSSAVLGVMFGLHVDEVQQIVGSVFPWQIPLEVGYIMAGGCLLMHVVALLGFKPEPLGLAFLDTVWLSLVSALLPLLLAFAVYFALWHSVNHLSELRNYLHYSRWTRLVWDGLPFTVLALVIVAVFALMLPSGGGPMEWVLFLFIAISLMTMPHMLLVDKMMRS